MSDYCGYSKSNNAVDAESEGRYPLTEATKRVAIELKITQKQARHILETSGTGEWHHTGSYFNKTDYYDVASIVEAVRDGEIKIPEKQKTVKLAPIVLTGIVEWIEWRGSRNHPIRVDYKQKATITYISGAVMASVHPEGWGSAFKKKVENLKIDGNDIDG